MEFFEDGMMFGEPIAFVAKRVQMQPPVPIGLQNAFETTGLTGILKIDW